MSPYAYLPILHIPTQGSRTIRTEEALLITMALLQPHIGNANIGGANGASNAEVGLRS